MDSVSSPSSLSSFTTKDEFEELEVAEFDANALWELLHDEPGEEETSSGGAPMQAMEAVGPNPVADNYWCLNDIIINNDDDDHNMVQDFNWFRMIEETSEACNGMGGWYGEPCMEEMNPNLEIGEYYSVSHSAILCDEIGYIGLWHDN